MLINKMLRDIVFTEDENDRTPCCKNHRSSDC